MPSNFFRPALLVLYLFAFSACQPSRPVAPSAIGPPADKVPNAASPAGASKTSMSLVAADPFVQYSLIKRTFISMEEADAIRSELSQEETFDLSSCDFYIWPSLDMGLEITPEDTRRNPIARLMNLAGDAILVEASLTAFGYPKELWEPLLASYETQMIPTLIKETNAENEYAYGEEAWSFRAQFRAELVAVLEEYRERHAPELRAVYSSEYGCGSEGFSLYIKTDPSDGVARFIPIFFHRLCTLQGIDPDDPLLCNYWREAIDGVLFSAIGYYRYHISWPDGIHRMGQLSFDDHEEGDTVVLRKN